MLDLFIYLFIYSTCSDFGLYCVLKMSLPCVGAGWFDIFPSLWHHKPSVPLLFQGLEEMGCVRKKSIKGQPRASLFSPLRASEVKEDGVKLRDNTMFYEPTLDCCLRLGMIFPHEPNWNKWVPFIHT